jgi:hypothetical protein
MRINEIASAEDQMALWRLVSDSVWQAIETQRQQQAQAEQAKAAKAKLKPRGSRKGKSRSAAPMPPPKKSPPPENPSTKPNPPPAANPQVQSPAQRQQALAPRMPVTTSAAPNALIAPKSGVFAPNTAAAAKPEAWSRQA